MLIAYQSMNSNNSTTHDIASADRQFFTRQANEYAVGNKHHALVVPHDRNDIATPVEGPANLMPIRDLPAKPKKRGRDEAEDEPSAKRRKAEESIVADVIGGQISLLWQNFNRAFGMMPDIMVCGELDASHPDFAKLVGSGTAAGLPMLKMHTYPSAMACQSFTAFARNKTYIEQVSSGTGYVAYSIGGVNVVFVHVPNAIATKSGPVEHFYKGISETLLKAGKIIHVVIGDTNQSGPDFTKDALNSAFGTSAYKNALDKSTISAIDSYRLDTKEHLNEQSGTNAKGTKFFDVAVYRSDILELLNPVAYLSQSSGGVTVTDHYGLAIQVGARSR